VAAMVSRTIRSHTTIAGLVLDHLLAGKFGMPRLESNAVWDNPAARIAGLGRHLPEAHSGGLEDRAREQDPQSQLEAGDGEAASRSRWMMDLPP
jgi:hypothetical protein